MGAPLDEHRRHLYLGEPDEDLVEGLEPDQLFDALHVPVPRRRLTARLVVALWALRAFLLLLTAAVVYVFVAGIVRGA